MKAVTPQFVERVKAKWLKHAPHLWWGDRLDARFVMVDAVRSMRALRVLDVGCNAGIMLSELGESSRRFGFDRSMAALELARKLNPSVPLVSGDMLALPYRDASMDVVLYCGMLELPEYDRKRDAVHEAARVLKPGGRLYLTTLNRRYRRYRTPTPSLRAVTREQLRDILTLQFEFAIKGFNPFPPFPYFLPNPILAAVPGIWRVLIEMMERDIAVDACCSFYVEAVRK